MTSHHGTVAEGKTRSVGGLEFVEESEADGCVERSSIKARVLGEAELGKTRRFLLRALVGNACLNASIQFS